MAGGEGGMGEELERGCGLRLMKEEKALEKTSIGLARRKVPLPQFYQQGAYVCQ